MVIENAYMKDVLPMTYTGNVMIMNTFQENVVTKDYKQYMMSTKQETTNREDGDAKTYIKNDVMPTTVINTSSGYDDPANPHQNKVTDKTGTKDGTKRLAITSARRGRGGITKCAYGNFATVAQPQLPPDSATAACSLD